MIYAAELRCGDASARVSTRDNYIGDVVVHIQEMPRGNNFSRLSLCPYLINVEAAATDIHVC